MLDAMSLSQLFTALSAIALSSETLTSSFVTQPQEGSEPRRGQILPPLFTLLLVLFG